MAGLKPGTTDIAEARHYVRCANVEREMSTLFISYASDDQAIALEVCAQLEAQGVGCWIAPRDVAPGAKWDEAIVDAIHSAGAFLLLLTEAANESPYVGNEVNHAFAAKKAIFTFRVEDVQPNKSLGFYLARHHWTDGFPPPIETKVAQLAAGVSGLIGVSALAGVAGTTTAAAAAQPKARKKAGAQPAWRRTALVGAAGALAGSLLVGAAWYATHSAALTGAGALPVNRVTIPRPLL